MGSLVYHVGLHKTGSTFLQKVLFVACEDLQTQGVHWQPRVALNKATGLGSVIRRVQEGHRLDTPRVADSAEKLRALVDEHRVVLISDETVLGRRVDFRYEGDAYTPGLPVLEWIRDEVTTDLRILMVVRRQDRFLESVYAQTVHQGGLEHFDEWYATVDPSRFGWFRLAQQIEAIVGEGHLTVRPFETIQQGSEAFCQDFFHAVDPTVTLKVPAERLEKLSNRSNPSLSQRGLDLAMLVYPELTQSERMIFCRVFLRRHFSNRQYDRAQLLSDEQAADLRAMHRDGNAELFARYIPDLDPAELGYV